MRRPARRSPPPPARPRSLGFGEYRSTVARCRREYRVGMPSISSSDSSSSSSVDSSSSSSSTYSPSGSVSSASGSSSSSLTCCFHSGESLATGLAARDDRRTKLSFSSAPRSSSSSSSESRRRLAGLRALPLRLVGAATSSSESSSAFSTFSLSSPGSAPAPRAVLRPLPPHAPPPSSSAASPSTFAARLTAAA